MNENLTLTSNLPFEKLKEFEGCRLEAYKCPAGVWTIGYGHTHGVKRGDVISQWWADELLHRDIAVAEGQVRKLRCCQTQGELDACVSFVFNLGLRKFKGSTLYRKIVGGAATKEEIQKEFRRWVYAGGKVMPGLVKRREWEAQRFFEDGDYNNIIGNSD